MSGHGESPGGRLRRTVYFSGRVQGVGFRFTTERVAADFDVTGYVRNLPDGRVELVAEGTAEELDRFVQAVERAMAGYIREVHVSESSATGQFSTFRIAY
ncbi:MAG: acylphosphatase [Planctomycetota bacterium]|nr:MAG: acylphosphatase [Planctomycetota bacterium]